VTKKNKIYQTLIKQIQGLEKEVVILKSTVDQNRKLLVYFAKQLQIIFDYAFTLSTIIDNNMIKNEKSLYISNNNSIDTQKMNEYIETLRKIEDELEKYKDDIIPGSVGES